MNIMAKIKITELKKKLKGFENKELTELIVELYKFNDDVKQYLSSKFIGEEANTQLYEAAKKKIKDEFFPERGFGKMRLNVAKKAITDFKKITGDLGRTLDLMLFYVEMDTAFTKTYGDVEERFYNSMASMYDKVATECEKDKALFLKYRERLYAVVQKSARTGWGYHDDLSSIYDSLERAMKAEVE
jgi:hypothetical protein